MIVALNVHRTEIPSAFDSEHDFRDYPGLPRKNEINGLTPAYTEYIRDDSMKHFPAIEQFLKNPRNEALKEKYHAVADELKGQLIVHRKHFTWFDEALEHVAILVRDRSPELQPAPLRRLIKIMIHYMYVNCEIGQKE